MSDDLDKLIFDLGAAPGKAFKGTDAIMKKGAHVTAEAIRAKVQESESLGQAAHSVSYDSMATIGKLRYEIGFDKYRRAGALGNIFEFGVMSPQGKRGGGYKVMRGALEAELPVIEKHMGDLLGKIL